MTVRAVLRRPYLLIAALVAATLTLPSGAAHADASGPGVVSAYPFVDPTLYTGETPDTAAASCWEIKQMHPTSPSGVYWLLTPSMSAPAQFWCDQDTDGGGWVKVGAGREGWETLAIGRGNATTLLQATPAANTQTTQLPAEVVDELLDGSPVTALTDGVRVRRAADTAGTTWQEVRVKTNKPVGWYWTFGAGWPVTNWTVGTSSGTGGSTSSFGSGSSSLRVDTSIGTNHQYTWGFSYGNGVTGLSAATSYLWTPTDGQGGARPFAEVYIRPKLINPEVSFSAIPNGGTAKKEKEVIPNSQVLTNPWGVTGIAGAVDGEGDVEVQAMARIGNTMYVGGNFATVQQDAAGTGQVNQPFLAAFNANTGAFVSSFRPDLDEAVQSLAALPDGRLAIGGKFTSVNGTPVTGLAVLNASTGALTPGWNTTLVNNVSPGLVRVLVLTSDNNYLYVGGSFTHTTGPSGPAAYARNAVRLNLSNFGPDATWRPEFNGSVQDMELSEDGTKIYVAGFFSAVSGTTATSAAALLTSSPAQVDPTPWNPVWSAAKSYQQGIEQVGNRIYSGGSEHNLFSFDTTTYERLTTQINNPKGDNQVVVADDEKTFLWAGSHSNNFTYQGATNWPSIGTAWTRADTIGWIGVWRLSDVSTVSEFTPTMRSRLGSGAWAVAEAGDGTMWVGGDFEEGRGANNATRWTGAFVRFGMTDGTAPNTPANFRINSQGAGTVTLAWNASAGGLGGGAYQILRDDRPIATTTSTSITVPTGGANRFFVRAADSTGNVSASSPVLVVPGGNPPPVASIAQTVDGLDVTFDGTGSTDNGSIAAYYWTLGDGTTSSLPSFTKHYVAGGTYQVSLVVVDDAGAWTRTSLALEVVQPPPTDPYGAAVFNDGAQQFWRLDETSGTTAYDAATGARPGSYQSGVVLNQADALVGAPGAAATFDGSNDQVVATTAVPGPTTYSAEAWFKTTTTRGGKIIGFGNAATGQSASYDRHVYMQNNGTLVFGVYTGVENRLTTAMPFNDGRWHHVVATQSSAGMALYVDGALLGSNTQAGAQDYTGYWRIGGDRTWSGATSGWLAGSIDEAAVYPTALGPNQVARHYALGLAHPYPAVAPADEYGAAVAADSPIAFWRLDGSQEGIVTDSTGLNPGQIGGGVTSGGPGVAGSTASAVFDGTSGFISERDARPAPSTYAAEVWFKSTSTTGGKLVGFGSSGTALSGSYDRHVFLRNDGRLTFGVYPGSEVTLISPLAYNDGLWHQVVAQQGPSGMQLFVDGALVASNATTTAQAYNGFWRIGGDRVWSGATSSYLNGSLDEVAIYAAPLSAARVAAHFAAGSLAPNQPPTAAFTTAVDGLDVDVDGSGSGDTDGTIASYAWAFGDGDTATGSTASHTYAAAGTYTITLTVTDNDGDTDTITHDVTVTEPPNSPPTAAFTTVIDNLDVDVDGSGSGDTDGTIASWAWEFGDGDTATGSTASHTYAAAGTYTVTLTVTDNRGDTDTITHDVTVTEPPNSPPTAAFTTVIDNLDVDVDGSGSGDTDGTIASWAWEFGDGDTATGSTASHTYAAAGTYTVTLTVTDNRGDTDTITHDVTVSPANQLPTAAFTSTVTDLSVDVDGNGSSDTDGTIASYAWAFGDGGTATGATASHTYAAAGTYTVTLTVTDNRGGTDSVSHDVTVTDPPNNPPTAAFTSTVDNLSVSVNGNGSSDTDGTIASYAWAFGDGGTATGATASHTYAAAGTYTVTLTVTDNRGGTDSVSHDVTVTDPPNNPPTAAFTSTVDNLSVSVNGNGSSDTDGTIASYAWAFGDGGTATGATASHTYATAGTYTVTLTVTDNRGGSDSVSHDVTVTDPGQTEVTTTPVTYDGSWAWWYQTAAPPTAWKNRTFDSSAWNHGGARLGFGATQIVTNIDTFPTTNDRARTAYFTKSFEVADASKVVSLTLETAGDDGVVVYVNGTEVGRQNMPTGTITHTTYASSARRITVAEATPLTIQVPTALLVNGTNVIAAETHLNYRATPDLSFRLRATQVTQVSGSNALPTAVFSSSVDGLRVDVNGSGSSDTDGTIASYEWSFGDGASGTGATASHTYGAAGTYDVSLTVTDNRGGTDTTTQQVTVEEAGQPVESTPVAFDASWRWWYQTAAPPTAWKNRTFDASAWNQGGARLGFGATQIVTNIDTFPTTNDRARAAYFVRSFDVTDASKVVSLTLDTAGDDGVVVYVNGTEVGRQNMPTGTITHTTYASSARRITVAEATPLTIQVPTALLVNGTNVIAAETHLNYRATPDISFRLRATMSAIP